MKKIVTFVLMIAVLMTCIPVNIFAADRIFVTITPSNGGGPYQESSIMYSTSSSGNFNISARTASGAAISSIVVTNANGDRTTYTNNNVDFPFNGYGVYRIEVNASSVPMKSIISLDIQQATKATYAIRYRTQTMVVTSVNGTSVDGNTFSIELGGSDRVPDSQRAALSSWLYQLRDSGAVSINGFQAITLQGHGLVKVYKDNGADGVELGTYDTSNSSQLRALTTDYGWDSGSIAAMKQRANMTLMFTPNLPSSAAVQVFIEGESGPAGYVAYHHNYLNSYEEMLTAYDRVEEFTLPLQPRYTDGRLIDMNKYKIDTTKSKLYCGIGKTPWENFVYDESKTQTITEIKDLTLPLSYAVFTYRADIYLKRKVEVDGRFGLSATPKEKEVEGERIVDTASLVLDLKQSATSIAKWKEYLDYSTNVAISITINRDDGQRTIINNSGIPVDGTVTPIDKNTLLQYLKGTDMILLDNIDWGPLATRGTKKYTYTAEVKVIADGETTVFVGNPNTDYISYFRPPITIPIRTKPVYFSEIKEGSPGNETFEAMAGVPTTRNLYFASGGSEFIVQAELEYIQNTSATRKYRSVFTGGVPSEFKEGDIAPNQTLGDQSADLHNGGTYSKTWTGSIPNKASAVTSLHSASCPAQPDRTAYNAALAEAQAFAAKINSTTLSFTCASDKQTRSYNAWGATVSPNPSDPQSTSASVSCSYRAPSGDPPSGGSPCGNEMATANPGGPGSYTITVTWTVPKHCICGPCCTHIMDSVEDTWTQTISFDHIRINYAKIWKLDQSAVGGMREITGTDGVVARVVAGDPNIYYNVSTQNNSFDGRIRYSLEGAQDDEVLWNEGPRSNKEDGTATNGVSSLNSHASACATGILYNNTAYPNGVDYHKTNSDAKDKASMEFKKFDERRNSKNIATIVSDFIILQTSSGDQSIFYFDKDSVEKTAQENFDKVEATKEEMWDYNSLSFADKDPYSINVGSYNGNYASPETKYNDYINTNVATKLDNLPAKAGSIGNATLLNRPARPTTGMRLVKTGIDIIDTIPNREYITGEASVFYKNILSYPNSDGLEYNSNYGAYGKQYTSPYSPQHTKVNDIVIHNPVATQYAIIVPLDTATIDQRTKDSPVGGNLQPANIETERVFDPNHPKQNLLFNGDCEKLDSSGLPLGWEKGEWNASGVYTHTVRRNDPTWTIANNNSFEIRSNVGEPANSSASYYKDLTTIPMTGSYTISGKLDAHRSYGTVEIYFIDSRGKGISGITAATAHSTGYGMPFSFNFSPPAGTAKIRVEFRKAATIVAEGADSYLFVDNVELINNDVNTWIPYDPVYDKKTIENPYYIAPVDVGFAYTGGVQTFVVPHTGTYTLEVWGAQGGNSSSQEGKGFNNGGYARGDITLTKGETIYIYVGGSGANSSRDVIDTFDGVGGQGGWNGGGNGTGGLGPGGGGATDIRRGGQDLAKRIIVGGGGGGCAIKSPTVSAAGGSNATTSISGQGENGCTSRHSSSYPNDEGGGGGGYFGGSVVHGDDTKCSYGGSSYIDGLTNTSLLSNVREGSGMARITAQAPATNVKQYITITTLASVQPPSEEPDSWYKDDPKITPGNTPIEVPGMGTFSPGNFINLDYPFTVYFPNKGDFYGNGALGIGATTSQRGKGYEDQMNTTEWTKTKTVTFDFNVMYNGHTYPAGKEIELPAAEEYFEFYCVLGNLEKREAGYQFKALANNSKGLDNDKITNKMRGPSLNAKHSSVKNYKIDLVGRIGNMVIEDTGDFRFSNFFKQPDGTGDWRVKNVVREVDTSKQNKIIGTTIDIRGNEVSAATNYLNTYGLLPHLSQYPVEFPLSPEKNNIPALQRQPIRLGYNVYCDIETIGNYYNKMTVNMYYYHLDLLTGEITPVDVYMSVNGTYLPINLYKDDNIPARNEEIHSFEYALNWTGEKLRRNVTTTEETFTSAGTSTTGAEKPNSDRYIFGNAQSMILTGRNRTLVGNKYTYNQLKDPDNKLNTGLFNIQGQRWHFTYGLPSSAVIVKVGEKPYQDNINALRNNNGVIVAAAEIIANGNQYSLGYKHPDGNKPIVLGGNTFSTTSIPYNVLSVFSASKSSADDLEVTGTH